MTQYYFLAASLPPLELDEKLLLPFTEFLSLCMFNLSKKDLKKLYAIQRYVDLHNLRNLLANAPWEACGSLDRQEMENAIRDETHFPSYVFEYLRSHENKQKQIEHFFQLYTTYFRKETASSKGFLNKYLNFEQEWRLVLVGFRAKRWGRDLAKELQYENEKLPIVMQILAQKDALNYEPPPEYEDLKLIFEKSGDSPLSLHKALCRYRFRKIEELCEGELFSLDRILAYAVLLIIVEQWQKLDAEQGKDIVQHMVKDVQ